jgi:hypothetical protein
MTETHSNPDYLRLSEVYAALAGRVNTEIETYWVRNNLLLGVNIAIFTVALAASGLQRLEHLVLAGIGNATTLLWLLVAIRGRRWLYFWEDRLADVEKSLPPPHVFPGHWKERSWRVRGGEPRSVTELVFFLPVVLLLAWVGYLALRFVRQ